MNIASGANIHSMTGSVGGSAAGSAAASGVTIAIPGAPAVHIPNVINRKTTQRGRTLEFSQTGSISHAMSQSHDGHKDTVELSGVWNFDHSRDFSTTMTFDFGNNNNNNNNPNLNHVTNYLWQMNKHASSASDTYGNSASHGSHGGHGGGGGGGGMGGGTGGATSGGHVGLPQLFRTNSVQKKLSKAQEIGLKDCMDLVWEVVRVAERSMSQSVSRFRQTDQFDRFLDSN